PAASMASARPAATAASGPITTRSAAISLARSTRAGTSVTPTLRTSQHWAMPGLPGAATRRVSLGEAAIFQARACSRPPDPTSRMFMARVWPARAGRSSAGEPAHHLAYRLRVLTVRRPGRRPGDLQHDAVRILEVERG